MLDDVTLRIAARIRGERAARRWSLDDLADRASVSKAMISKIERGEASPTAALLGRLSAAYGLTLSGPNPARYGLRSVFRGAVVPAERGLSVALTGPSGKVGIAKTGAKGTYVIRARVKAPGQYAATSARGTSPPLALRVVPKLVAGLAGSGAVAG